MRAPSLALATACLGALSAPAFAHFKLNLPQSRTVQDAGGSPQKSAPCGITDSSTKPDQSTPTNIVSTLKSGSMITISIDEVLFHPGHYRVALAQDVASLPADPQVTPGTMACGTTTIQTNPTMPVLADGLFVHTSPFGGTQSAQIQLPAGMTCNNCVLQVTQFMSAHPLNNPGGCFYHHCATVNITADGPQDAGVTPGDDAGTTPGGGGGGGCCDAGTSAGGPGALALASLVAGFVLRRRRV